LRQSQEVIAAQMKIRCSYMLKIFQEMNELVGKQTNSIAPVKNAGRLETMN
jgi:hypothetical protein